MAWSDLERTLPEQPTPERERQLLEAVRLGPIVHEWATVVARSGAHTVELEVSRDALMVGVTGDAVRIAVNATTAQQIADHLGALLLTPRVPDLIRQQAVVLIAPATQTPNAAMANTSRMVAHSRNYRRGRTSSIDTIVIHTMEATEKPDTAERVAQWFAGPSAPMASAHHCVDSDSVVQCVLESDMAFHAPGANHNGIGVEHAGYAKQTMVEEYLT